MNRNIAPDAKQVTCTIRLIPQGVTAGKEEDEPTFKGFIFDLSSSMLEQNKHRDQQAAFAQGFRRVVRLGDWFMLVGINDGAIAIFPKNGRPIQATEVTIERALEAASKMQALGDTFMSKALRLVHNGFVASGCLEGVVALFTDGQANNKADKRGLRNVLRKFGAFYTAGWMLRVEPIAIGKESVGPNIAEGIRALQQIQTGCRGSKVHYVEPGAGVDKWVAVLDEIFNGQNSRMLRGVTLKFTGMSDSTSVRSVKIITPRRDDLTGALKYSKDGREAEVGMTGWQDDVRLVEIVFDVQPQRTGVGITAGELVVSYRIGNTVYELPPETIPVFWSNIADLTLQVPADVALAAGIVEVQNALSLAVDAYHNGDRDTAMRWFRVAYEKGDANLRKTLESSFVEVDPATGNMLLREVSVGDTFVVLGTFFTANEEGEQGETAAVVNAA
jgi:hypothetical protein